MPDLTLSDVQGLLSVHDAIQGSRHMEVLERLDRVEVRLRDIELREAENRPYIKGTKAVVAYLGLALIAGYFGSFISVS